MRAPSPALVISLIALFVALGGTSYAAIKLPKNSVGTKQLKKNAVTGVKIKNKAVTAAKINTNGLTVPNATHATSADSATSATNATNATHATSADSATNATNASHATNADHATTAGSAPLPSTLPTGETERGAFAAIVDVASSGQGAATEVSWPIPLASDPTVHIIAPGSGAPTGCSGSVSNPGASSGNLCIFLEFKGAADGPITTINPESNSGGSGKSGAVIYDNSGSNGRNDFWGVFAVTG